MLTYKVAFSGSQSPVSWHGCTIENTEEFESYLRGPVRSRMMDDEHRAGFEADLRGLATTGMASEALSRLLVSSAVAKQPWEVGEAVAECLLEDEHAIRWPWNRERDKLTPKASLPGADLVGFIGSNGKVRLILGEVKTSSDQNAPPVVMNGRSGMAHQLDSLAHRPEIHVSVLKWLHARCKNTDLWEDYKTAVKCFLDSEGRDLLLFGVLMRDTKPNLLDLEGRGRGLAKKVTAPTQVRLDAWYSPCPIGQWPSLAGGGEL